MTVESPGIFKYSLNGDDGVYEDAYEEYDEDDGRLSDCALGLQEGILSPNTTPHKTEFTKQINHENHLPLMTLSTAKEIATVNVNSSALISTLETGTVKVNEACGGENFSPSSIPVPNSQRMRA